MRGRYERQFLKEIGKIKDIAVFLGVARVLKVQTMKDKDTPKEFNEVFKEIIDNYFAAEPKRQKELLDILKAANKCKEKIEYGNSTKDSAKTGTNEKV